MKIVIRTDASSDIGHGHIMRCLTLSRALQDIGFMVGFVCRKLPKELQSLVHGMAVRLFALEASDLTDDSTQTLAIAEEFGATAILVDGYQFDPRYLCRLAKGDLALIVMDDLNDRGSLYAAMVINSLPNAQKLGYEYSAPDATLLLGLQYALVRQEFCQQHLFTEASKRPRFLVNFGGSDILGLSVPLVRLLLKEDPSLPITLITGSGFRYPSAVQRLTDLYPNMEHIHSCGNMAEQMRRSGFALAAPGATVYELAACGVPAIFLICAENQRLSAYAHQQHGWCRVFDAGKKEQIASALQLALQLWRNSHGRDLMQKKAGGLIDGKGAVRISRKITQLAGFNE